MEITRQLVGSSNSNCPSGVGPERRADLAIVQTLPTRMGRADDLGKAGAHQAATVRSRVGGIGGVAKSCRSVAMNFRSVALCLEDVATDREERAVLLRAVKQGGSSKAVSASKIVSGQRSG